MSASLWLYRLFAGLLLVLVLVMGWSYRMLYQAEVSRVEQDVEAIVLRTAEDVQAQNMTLNNLAKSYTDKDQSSKIAFAIGMTQNQGKLSMDFGEQEEDDKPVVRKDSLPSFDKQFLQQKNIQFNAEAVVTIHRFDSLLRKKLTGTVNVPYTIQQIDSRTIPKVAHASKLFIINFYEPDVYRVVYDVPATLVWQRMWLFVIVGLGIMLLFATGFVLYRKSYKLQLQMTAFKDNLLGNFTHELKTPITSLQLLVQKQRDHATAMRDDEQFQYVQLASAELNRIKLLTEKILSYGRLDREQFDLDKQVVSIEDVIEEAIAVMSTFAASKDAHVKNASTSNAEVMGDRLLLVNMLTVVIDNAIKYNSGKAEVMIATSTDRERVSIMVKDNGIGIAAQYQYKVFEPFFRVPTDDVHNTAGHGLGLSFAKQTAALHGGGIAVVNNEDGGCTVSIQLPAL